MRRPNPDRPGFTVIPGFTLIEVLVALTILAGALAVLLPSFSTQVALARHARSGRIALVHAQSLLDGAVAAGQIAAGTTDGTTPDGFIWRQTVTPLPPTIGPNGPLPALAEITVSVGWDGGRRSVDLTGVAMARAR